MSERERESSKRGNGTGGGLRVSAIPHGPYLVGPLDDCSIICRSRTVHYFVGIPMSDCSCRNHGRWNDPWLPTSRVMSCGENCLCLPYF